MGADYLVGAVSHLDTFPQPAKDMADATHGRTGKAYANRAFGMFP